VLKPDLAVPTATDQQKRVQHIGQNDNDDDEGAALEPLAQLESGLLLFLTIVLAVTRQSSDLPVDLQAARAPDRHDKKPPQRSSPRCRCNIQERGRAC